MIVRIITFKTIMVWLFIQQLHRYENHDFKILSEGLEYLCYFKFSEPTQIIFGELIRELEMQAPIIFRSPEEAETYATDYLEKRYQLRK